jgi:hypothetical protein
MAGLELGEATPRRQTGGCVLLSAAPIVGMDPRDRALRSGLDMAAALPARPNRYAVHQPNFLPWCGYFAKIAAVDAFVLLDDAQMPRGRSYVSRVAIRKGEESCWLTVPVRKRDLQEIREVELDQGDWRQAHLNLLRDRYGREAAFKDALALVLPAYEAPFTRLSELNIDLLDRFCHWLGLDVPMVKASSLRVDGKGDERIARIGQALGAGCYVSGKGGENYQDDATYLQHGVRLQVTDASDAWGKLDSPPAIAKGHSIFEAAAVLGQEGAARLIAKLAATMIHG